MSLPKFHNEPASPEVCIGVTQFACIGVLPPHDHPHIYLSIEVLTPRAIAALDKALDDPDRAIQAAAILLDRGWGKPAIVAQVNARVVGGIDCPPRCDTIESAEQWLERRRKELAALSPAKPLPPIVDAVAEEPSQPEPLPTTAPAPPQQQQSTTAMWTAAEEEAWHRREERRQEGITTNALWDLRERGPRRW